MEGYDYSFQDDLFRAIVVGGVLIGGIPWYQHCMSLEREEMYKFKKVSNFIEIENVFNLENVVEDKTKIPTIREQLGVVMSTVRQKPDTRALPDHAAVLAALDTILSAL